MSIIGKRVQICLNCACVCVIFGVCVLIGDAQIFLLLLIYDYSMLMGLHWCVLYM
jgi:hypothetical protein